jgi:YegS/Rv2252/BmrU family lipid kinase
VSWWVIANPSAGRGHEIRDRAREALDQAGVAFVVHESDAPGHVAELVRLGLEAGFSDFAAVGGDGTAHLVLNGLMGADPAGRPTLAILPAGSGSDFIRTFALPDTLRDAARHLSTPDRYPTDIGRIEGAFGIRWFLNAANVGVAAASARVAQRLPPWLGKMRYRVGFWLALPRFGKDEVTVTVDHHRLQAQLLTVVVANGQFFGGGLNIAPRASVMDGAFDVQCFSGPRRAAFSVMPRVARGGHLTHPSVRRYVGAEVTIEVPDSWPVEADGEVLGAGSVRVSIVRNAIQFKI